MRGMSSTLRLVDPGKGNKGGGQGGGGVGGGMGVKC